MRFENARMRDRGLAVTEPDSPAAQWRIVMTAPEGECQHEFTICDACVMEWSDWEIEVQEVNVPWVAVEDTLPDREYAFGENLTRPRRKVVVVPNRNVPWTLREEDMLVSARKAGQDWPEIAAFFGRSVRAVEQRWAVVMAARPVR